MAGDRARWAGIAVAAVGTFLLVQSTCEGDVASATASQSVDPRAAPTESAPTPQLTVKDASDAGPDAFDGGAAATETASPTPGQRAFEAELRANAEDAERFVEDFCDQSREIQQRVSFGKQTRERDAAVYMAGRMDWSYSLNRTLHLQIGTLHLPDLLTKRMKGGTWQLPPETYQGLDFTWMQDLAQFDHWSLSAAGPLRDEFQVAYYSGPQPESRTLSNWVKLRLLKGLHEGQLMQASVEVRHLGDLTASWGTLVGDLTRFGFLSMERAIWEHAGLEVPASLPSAADLLKARRAAVAPQHFLYPGGKREVLEKTLACAPNRCSTLQDAIGLAALLRGRSPLVRKHLEWLLAQHPCDPDMALRIARSPPAPPDLSAEAAPPERSPFEDDSQERSPIEQMLHPMTEGGL